MNVSSPGPCNKANIFFSFTEYELSSLLGATIYQLISHGLKCFTIAQATI